ncbi:hypothetical protein ES703_43963 [subsurface metagenome]
MGFDEWKRNMPDRLDCAKRNVRWEDAAIEWLQKKSKRWNTPRKKPLPRPFNH